LLRLPEEGTMKSIRIAAPVLAASLLCAAPGASQESARILALGGASVAGIIPDAYTDLSLSPVYALDARPALWYTRRSSPSLQFVSGLPYVDATVLGGGNGYSYNHSNEGAVHGLKLGAWRIALTSQWSFNKLNRSDPEALISARYGNEIRSTARYRDADADAWLLDIAAARPAGGGLIFGTRVRGRGLYDHSDDVFRNRTYDYDDSPFTDLAGYYKFEQVRNYVSRRVGFDLQCALGRTRDGSILDEISATLSIHRLARLSQSTDYELNHRFNQYGETSSFNRYFSGESDSREGDLWSAGAAYRRSFSGGTRLCAEGSLSFLSYDLSSGSSSARYIWNYNPPMDDRLSASLAGDGSVIRGALAARAGKGFSIHRMLDLYVTAGCLFVRSACDEDPLMGYVYRESGETAFAVNTPVIHSSVETRASLSVPLSIDFHPSSWFSYFASFIPYAQWSRVTGEEPLASPFVFYPPAAARLSGGRAASTLAPGLLDEPFATVDSRDENFDTSHSFACGFSLRYQERFSVDFYTRYDIVPDYWSDILANVRVGF